MINISENENVVSLRKSLIATTTELIFLNSESILEEFNKVLTPGVFPEYNDKIILLKRESKPAIDRFNKWSERRLFRNSLVAHNLRLNDKTSLFERKEKLKINAPNFDNDFVIIYYLHVYLCMCIGKHFPTHVKELNRDTIIDMIEFTGQWTSLHDELPIIEGWFRSFNFHYEELSNHVEFLNTKKS
ncbi:hypothetical protein [uncultured Cytophaga sp.]|uniref:hypothetical protein n=1 Tax=uncultured Cytophaga sp. TaxID=160238 RepID=UPI00260B6483|nr:hypothetical protein [uncultured Cytophaga sp.]